MTSSNQYVLGRGYVAGLRLNAQHLLWKEQLGYVIHPQIPIRENLMVADIGAGTGIWLLEASKQLPKSSTLHGYDIDVSQSPAKKWLPPNLSHCTWDAFSDVPTAMVEKYDIVHIGIFFLLIANNDPVPILKNLIKLLKPGGYLQWNELDWAGRRIVSADTSLPQDDIQKLLDYVSIWEDALGPKSWISDLSKIYTSQGLMNIVFDRFEIAPEYLRYDTDKCLTAYEEFSRAVLDPRGKGEGNYLRELVEKAFQECRNGVAITADMVVAVARKP